MFKYEMKGLELSMFGIYIGSKMRVGSYEWEKEFCMEVLVHMKWNAVHGVLLIRQKQEEPEASLCLCSWV